MTNTPLKSSDPELFSILYNEIIREDTTLELIASENFVSYPVLEMAGGIMTNKYAEGYPGNRYYGGCEFVIGFVLSVYAVITCFYSCVTLMSRTIVLL